MDIAVLVIRDDELDMGDNEVASLDVAEGGKTCGTAGKLWECGKTLGTRIRLAGPGFLRMGEHVVLENTLF